MGIERHIRVVGTDDRGTALKLGVVNDVVPNEEIRRLRRAAASEAGGDVPIDSKRVVLPVLGGAAWLVGWLSMTAAIPLPWWMLPIVLMAGWVAIGLLAHRLRLRADPETVTTVFLRGGRCPNCGYSLCDLVAEEDGCVVCPECAAAWRSSRVRRQENSRHPTRSDRVPRWPDVSTIDDRGAETRLDTARIPARSRDAQFQRLHKASYADRTSAPDPRFVVVLITFVACCGAWLFVWGKIWKLLTFPKWVFPPVMLGGGLVIALFVMRALLRTPPRRTVEVFLRAGRCPGCGTSLAESGPAEDGCVVCTACGAAWKRDRVGRDETK